MHIKIDFRHSSGANIVLNCLKKKNIWKMTRWIGKIYTNRALSIVFHQIVQIPEYYTEKYKYSLENYIVDGNIFLELNASKNLKSLGYEYIIIKYLMKIKFLVIYTQKNNFTFVNILSLTRYHTSVQRVQISSANLLYLQ